MAAAGALGMEGVDSAALESSDRIFDESRLVQGVSVDHDLDIKPIRNGQCAIDRGRRGAPVLVQLHAGRAGAQHFLQSRWTRCVSLRSEGQIDGQAFRCLQHPGQMPRSGGARGRRRASRRTGAAANQRGDSGGDRLLHLLRADEVYMRVYTTSGEDLAFARDDFGAGADYDIDIRLYIGITGLADFSDPAVSDGDIGLHDAPMIDDQ